MEPLLVDVVHFYPKENAQPHNTVKSCMKQPRGSLLKLVFDVTNVHDVNQITTKSVADTFDIDNMVQVCIQFEQKPSNDPIMVQIKCRKSSSYESEANICLNLNVKSDDLKHSAQFLCTELWTDWINIGNKSGKYFRNSTNRYEYQTGPFEVSLIASKKKIVTFANLFEDTDLTDFELSTAEGSVSLHKALLAAHSDVFRTMLCHEWKETANASIQIQGVTLQTLKQLKEYIYMDALPEAIDDLRRLLVLASYYFMDNLRSECIIKLTQMVKPENLQSLVEYACANNIPELIFAIIEQTSCETVHNARFNRKLGIIQKKDLPNLLQSVVLKKDVGSGDFNAHEEIDDVY